MVNMKHEKTAKNRVENPQNMDHADSVGMAIKKFTEMDHHKLIDNSNALSAFSVENLKKTFPGWLLRLFLIGYFVSLFKEYFTETILEWN